VADARSILLRRHEPDSLRHRRQGSRTIVFVHGWACHIGSGASRFRAGDKARLILIDLPGHGQSDKPPGNLHDEFFCRGRAGGASRRPGGSGHLHRPQHGRAVLCRVHHHAPEKSPALVPWTACSAGAPARRRNKDAARGGRLPRRISWPRQKIHQRLFPVSRTEALRRVTAEMLAHATAVMLSRDGRDARPAISPTGFCGKWIRPSCHQTPGSWWQRLRKLLRSLSPQVDIGCWTARAIF